MFTRRLRECLALGTVLLVVASLSPGCWLLQSASDEFDCERALEVICACDSRPCDLESPPEIVTAMRRCNHNDVRPDGYEGNIHICINDEGSRFCAVLDGMLREDGSLCEAHCSNACSPALVARCQSYQYERCDVPAGDGGAGGAGG